MGKSGSWWTWIMQCLVKTNRNKDKFGTNTWPERFRAIWNCARFRNPSIAEKLPSINHPANRGPDRIKNHHVRWLIKKTITFVVSSTIADGWWMYSTFYKLSSLHNATDHKNIEKRTLHSNSVFAKGCKQIVAHASYYYMLCQDESTMVCFCCLELSCLGFY